MSRLVKALPASEITRKVDNRNQRCTTGRKLPTREAISWLVLAPLCWWLFLRDQASRTVVLFYDVNDAPAAWFDALVTQWGLAHWISEGVASRPIWTSCDHLSVQDQLRRGQHRKSHPSHRQH